LAEWQLLDLGTLATLTESNTTSSRTNRLHSRGPKHFIYALLDGVATVDPGAAGLGIGLPGALPPINTGDGRPCKTARHRITQLRQFHCLADPANCSGRLMAPFMHLFSGIDVLCMDQATATGRQHVDTVRRRAAAQRWEQSGGSCARVVTTITRPCRYKAVDPVAYWYRRFAARWCHGGFLAVPGGISFSQATRWWISSAVGRIDPVWRRVRWQLALQRFHDARCGRMASDRSKRLSVYRQPYSG